MADVSQAPLGQRELVYPIERRPYYLTGRPLHLANVSLQQGKRSEATDPRRAGPKYRKRIDRSVVSKQTKEV